MSNCKETAGFLESVRARSVTGSFPPTDLATLQHLGLVQVLSNDDFGAVSKEVEGLASARDAILADGEAHARLAAQLAGQTQHTRSILFHFESKDHRGAEEAEQAKTAEQLAATETDLRAREAVFAQLSAKKTLVDSATPYAGGYVAITGLGALALRDLSVAMYRAADDPFDGFWSRTQEVDRELDDLSNQSAGFVTGLASGLSGTDPSYLWAIAIGLAKQPGDRTTQVPRFLNAVRQIGPIAHNDENLLMAAEVLTGTETAPGDALGYLRDLDRTVQRAGVPEESSLGVAAILFAGRRADGTFATDGLDRALTMTRSFEAAALLAVVNRPWGDLSGKFASTHAMFTGWGYSASEDLELSCAYLTVSELPPEGLPTKLGILAQGLRRYLQYPLVGASILASIPVLEANETLNLLEKAYETLGRRTGPMSQPELICLAIRLLHGIQVASVNELDATAAAVPTAARAPVFAPVPRFFFVPMIVAHGHYFSTFSGIGGMHPGHVHSWGGYSG